MKTGSTKKTVVRPEDVPHSKAVKILEFLNSVRNPEEVAGLLNTTGNPNQAMRVAEKLLNRRSKLGAFRSLKEVSDVREVGNIRFARIVSALSDAEFATDLFFLRPAVSIDGRENTALSGELLSFSIEESAGGGPRCEAIFNNWGRSGAEIGYLWFDNQLLDFGKEFRISLGNGVFELPIFEGDITSIRGVYPSGNQPRVFIKAENPFEVKLRKAFGPRKFSDETDEDVMREIAAEHGITCTTDAGTVGVIHPVLVKTNQSDMGFLIQRANAIGSGLVLEGNNLHLFIPGSRGRICSTLTYGRNLTEFEVAADLAGQVTVINTLAWDASCKSISHYSADENNSGLDFTGFRYTGSRLLSRLYGESRKDVSVEASGMLELELLAKACYADTAKQFVTGRGITSAYKKLSVGSSVNITGLGPLFSGVYELTGINHIFNQESGTRTVFSVRRSGL